jgi:hypothetical protein
MTKKHPDKDEIKTRISNDLRIGKSRSQILSDLESEYYDLDHLAKLVVGTANPEVKENYKGYNVVLGILVLSLVGFRFFVFRIDYAGSGLSILTLIMGLSIFKYEAIAYRLIGIISIATFLRYVFSFDFDRLLITDFVMSVSVVALSFYLGVKLFPQFGILGPKKDGNGNYVID